MCYAPFTAHGCRHGFVLGGPLAQSHQFEHEFGMDQVIQYPRMVLGSDMLRS